MAEKNKPIRILLVEDNSGDAYLLREALTCQTDHEFQLTHAPSLGEALAALSKQPFDLVLSDLSLPDSDGISTVNRIIEAAKLLPLVVLTGQTGEETGLEAVRHGAQDYLSKGRLNPDLLVRSIHYAIERKEVQRALQNAHDELERKVKERTADLQALNQVLKMVIACNEALVRVTDEPALLAEVCRNITSIGDYRMAWVGFAENDAAKTVRPVAAVGFEDGYLAGAGISWADDEFGRGPTGTAIRTGELCIGEDFLTDDRLRPWRGEATKRGYRSSIAIPLISGGRVIGALMIYSAQPYAFEPGRAAVLKQLADDLSYGIASLRAAAERQRLERDILETAEREQSRIGRDLHDSVQSSLAGISMMLGGVKRKVAKLPAGGDSLAAEVDNIGGIVKQTLDQTRGLARGLCPMELKAEGLMKAFEQLAATTAGMFHIQCSFGREKRVLVNDEKVASQLYYIGQEAVNNALRHSKAKTIAIHMDGGADALCLTVEDDGVGMPQDGRPVGGMGLRTMAYRAKMIGAALEITPGRPGGVTIRCRIRGPFIQIGA